MNKKFKHVFHATHESKKDSAPRTVFMNGETAELVHRVTCAAIVSHAAVVRYAVTVTYAGKQFKLSELHNLINGRGGENSDEN